MTASLGKNTESVFRKNKKSTKSGTYAEAEKSRIQARQHRYDMQRMAAQVTKKSRVAACQKIPSYMVQKTGGKRGISVNENGKAHFHGVGSCGDVWTCPVCSQRISEARRREILDALSAHRDSGGIAVLVTWTFSHSRNDDLAELVPQFCKALRTLKARRIWKKTQERLGYIGQIRALEVTHSERNGWHPHAHEIWFLDREHITPAELAAVKAELFATWQQCCVKAGLGMPTEKHGLDIQFREGDQGEILAVGAYAAKWGHELTYAHMKRGKGGSRSPWAILDNLTSQYSYRDACLFREYANAFAGRAQLFWSRGLKAHFGIDDIGDEELADRPEKIHVTDLTTNEWQSILKTDSRALVLHVAEKDPLFLRSVIDDIVQQCRDEKRRRSELKRMIEQQTLQRMREMGISA